MAYCYHCAGLSDNTEKAPAQGDGYAPHPSLIFVAYIKKSRWCGSLELIKSSDQHHQQDEGMLNQTVLPFKLTSTTEMLAAHIGLALFGEFCAAMK